jgi:hypothetical protein
MKQRIYSPLTRTLLFPRPSIRRSIINPSKYQHSPTPTHTMSSTSPTPNLSPGYDPEEASQDLAVLLKSSGGRWTLTADGKGIERTFKFKTFKKTWVSVDDPQGELG